VTTSIERVAALHVGLVESVSPDSIAVLLDVEAPQTTALNTGVPTAFPRLNGYVLIPKEGGALVGLVVWLGTDRSPWPRRPRGAAELELVDLPFPLRRMEVAPIGTLRHVFSGGTEAYQLERGVAVFPSVGDQVLMPSRSQLRAVIEPEGVDRRVQVGTAVLAAGAKVTVDPDRLFGRHLAVLGNTGSGKSCTVAGLVRWSLEAAQRARREGSPNARFIVLDPNGEYGRAFDDVPGGVRRFQVPPVQDAAEARALLVPAWLWNGHEWGAFAAASPRVQRPVLMQALRDVRSAALVTGDSARDEARAWTNIKLYRDMIVALSAKAITGSGGERRQFGQTLPRIVADASRWAERMTDPAKAHVLQALRDGMKKVVATHPPGNGGWFDPFSAAAVDEIREHLETCLSQLTPPPDLGVESEDAPITFQPKDLLERLEVLSIDEGAGTTAFLSTLILRVRSLLTDRRMGDIVAPEESPSLQEWLSDYVGADGASNGAVAVVDLSLVPSDVIHTVVAVVGRVVFEATQRYRRLNQAVLPTVLVLEEAHTFVHRYDGNDDEIATPAQMCRKTFERIAREGRKFGLGLLLSSQRPSELSQTVLAQCNTFILHRLVNDRDQDLVRRLVPDNLSGLLRELPTLPTRHALLLGWATALPVLMEVRELHASSRPQSADPSFWRVWTGEEPRPINWQAIADDWSDRTKSAPTPDPEAGEVDW
jgi:DNA helicase HerA-like ATPase